MKLPSAEQFKDSFNNEIWREAARSICQRHNLKFENLRRAEHGESVVFLADNNYVIKIYIPGKRGAEREKLSLETVRTSLTIPEIAAYGEIENYKYLVTTQIAGELMTKDIWLELPETEQISVLSQLAKGLRELHDSDNSKISFDWNEFVSHQAKNCFERQKSCNVNEKVLAQIPAFLEENLKLLPANFKHVFMHGDVHFGNLRLLQENGKWRISGLFDFADSLKGFHEYEFLAVGLLMIQGQGNLQREFFRLFGYADSQIDETLRKRLMLLTMFYEWSDLRRYAIRLRPEAVDYSLDELERAIWNFV